MKPKVLTDDATIISTCSLKVNGASNVTPKSLKVKHLVNTVIQSEISLIVEYSLTSSANKSTFKLNISTISLINKRKSKGPKLDPWGTPEFTTSRAE
jgi:hypothetical protein